MKNTEVHMELQKTLTEINQKHTYFLLAAVGACVGFAITQTKDSALSWSFLPLAVGLFFWGLSFVTGCFSVKQVARMINANIRILEIKAGRNSCVGDNPINIEQAIGLMQERFESHNLRATCFQRSQFCCFISGVLCFIAWHILGMWCRTNGCAFLL